MQNEKARKYEIPNFLRPHLSQPNYNKWLNRTATAHLRRDRARKNKDATGEDYKREIHDAVCRSEGQDAYTGEMLRWDFLGTYNNEESQLRGRDYKHERGLSPTVDHVGDGTGKPNFKICALRTNDAKGDLPLEAFLELCRKALDLAGYRVSKPND